MSVQCPSHHTGPLDSYNDCPMCAGDESCVCFCFCTSYRLTGLDYCWECLHYCMPWHFETLLDMQALSVL